MQKIEFQIIDPMLVNIDPRLNPINKIVEKIAMERSKWIDDQYNKILSKFDKFVIKNAGILGKYSYKLVNLLGFKTVHEHYNQLGKVKISIYRFDKLIVSKIFKN